MSNVVRDLWEFYRECWREAHSKAWAAANGLFGSLVGLVMTMLMPLDFFPYHPNWSKVLTFVIYSLLAYIVFLLFMLFFVAPFLAWRKERTARLKLLEIAAIKPRLKCSFNVRDDGCFRPGTKIYRDGNHPIDADWYRVRVDAEGGNIPGCQARLISVQRDKTVVFSGDGPPLDIVHHGSAPVTICAGVPEYVDLLFIDEYNYADTCVAPARRTSSADWGRMFSQPGNYIIRAAVRSPEAETALIDVKFNWTMNRSTSEISSEGVPKLRNGVRQSAGF
jgi:hypothetical protein